MRLPLRFLPVYVLLLAAGLVALYANGLHHKLIFDDNALLSGSLFEQYAQFRLQVRVLSYGSFVWVRDLFGENWPLQRLINVAIHGGNALLIGALSYRLLLQTQWSERLGQGDDLNTTLRTSSFLAAAVWAFHPVTVYGTGYLIQRSILLATFFVLLMLLLFVLGLQKRQPLWHLGSALAFVLGLSSKEYAISALLLLPVLLVYVRRPGLKTLALSAGAVVLVLAGAAALILQTRGNLIGEVFDDISRAMAQQLEALRPGITQDLYSLSILNQATLFWRYGMTWFLPLPSFMSIDIRPTFPLRWWSVELAGALIYAGATLAALAGVWRYRDWRGLLSLAFAVPALLFVTEFATVWLQDPFVLYRSYLWSISWPLLLALPLVFLAWQGRLLLTLSLCLGLGVLSFLRLDTLSDTASVWSDAVAKTDLKAAPNAVGRYRAYLNLGADALERGNLVQAQQLLNTAEALGEPMGSALMNIGVLQQQQKLHPLALDAFAKAERKGFQEASLYFHQGESYFALRDFAKARENYTLALQKPQSPEATLFTRVRRAEAASAAQDPASALQDYRALLEQKPDVQRYRIGLIMSLNALGQWDEALAQANQLIARQPTHAAYFARALIHRNRGQLQATLQDIQAARRLAPDNPTYQAIEQQLSKAAPR